MRIQIIQARTRLILFIWIIGISIAASCPGVCSRAYADDSWKQDMADICSKTDDAMTLSKEELKAMLQKLDSIRAVIDTLEETPRKVNLRRLEMCKNLLAFVLESKEAEQKK